MCGTFADLVDANPYAETANTVEESARQCVEDDDVNVLCLGARVIGPELMADLVRAIGGG